MVLTGKKRWRLAVLAGLLSGLAFPAYAATPTDLLSLYVDALNSQSDTWVQAIASYGSGIAFWVFRTLAILHWVLYFIRWVMHGAPGGSLAKAFADFFTRYFWMVFLLGFIGFWGGYGGLPQQFFLAVAQTTTGIQGMDPLEMTDQAMGSFLAVFFDENMLVPFLTNGPALILGSMAVVMFSYVIIVSRQVQILTESMYLYSIGALFLSFGVAPFTAGLADGWIRKAVQSGLKLLGLFFSIAIGAGAAQLWTMQWEQIPIFDIYSQMVALIRFAFGMVAWTGVVVLLPSTSAEIGSNYTFGIESYVRGRGQ